MRWVLAALGVAAVAAVVLLSLDRTRSRSFMAPERRAPDARPEERRRIPQRAAKPFPLDGPRTLDVTVVEKGSERPLADAVVEVEAEGGALELPPTDAGGETGLDGLADGLRLRLRPQAPGYPKEVLWIRHTVRGDARLKLRVDPGRRLDWPVRAGAPPAGTPVTFVAYPGVRLDPRAARGRIEGGALKSRGLLPGGIKAVAVAPDRSAFAIVTADPRATTGPPVTFVPPCILVVRATERSGLPAPGIAFELRTAKKPSGHRATTDDHGRAVFEGLLPLPGVLRMENLALRRVDLRDGDVELDVPVEPEVEVVAECVVDGVARLPRGHRVLVHRRHVAAVPGPEPGTLRLRARPRRPYDPLRVTLVTHRYGRHERSARDGRVRFEMGATGRLIVRGIDVPTPVVLERQLPGGWVRVDSVYQVAFDRLPPGRYRVRDRASGERSGPVEVRAWETASVVLDVTGTGWASGHVVAPGGAWRGIRILVDGIGRVGVDPHGSFRVRVPGRRAVDLEPSHPTFVAEGRVRVRGAQDGIVLRMRPGPSAAFRLDPQPPARAIRVALYAGPLDADPARGVNLMMHHMRHPSAVTIGGFAPGAYTLWVDVPGFRPVARPDVVLGDGGTDLGTIRLVRGALLRFPPGFGRGMVTVTATHLGHPAYTRDAIGGLDRGVAVTGLGAGRFRVVCAGRGDTRVFYDRTIAVDGESDYVLD